MTTREKTWAPGTPCWVDYGADDLDAAVTFYSEVFGWSMQSSGAEFGGYTTAQVDGHDAAGIGPKQGPPEAPAMWTTYLATDDADATTASIRAGGGQVLAEPMQIGDMGRIAVAMDPQGAIFGLWEAGTMIGADIVDEPGTLTWTDAMVGDPETDRTFYSSVFSWSYAEMPGAPSDYRTITVGERSVGGIGPAMHEGMPPSWLTYFSVADADETAARVTSRGGRLIGDPFDTPFGRMALLADPWGAVFAVMGQSGAA